MVWAWEGGANPKINCVRYLLIRADDLRQVCKEN